MSLPENILPFFGIIQFLIFIVKKNRTQNVCILNAHSSEEMKLNIRYFEPYSLSAHDSLTIIPAKLLPT